ncbi:polyamine aminopropyltransferase [Kingella sp. SNUBH-2017]|uniref:polyamine aminopropyltransferase n=1 Tax=Kingella sp. SNUBH-2017 TaxID=2994077 RepID=UPI0023638E66|nr:polyamine aminopropyltransferase [Kingella sp. SNUBH-2017]MDD2182180.1 polyamine aminopropyltransferase [Kingella sp. SNUBH-2017]
MTHPHQRRRIRRVLPEAGISESGNIRSLHLDSPTVQSSMNLDDPSELVLSYSRAMMAWLMFVPTPRHITHIGLGGGSFARWIDAFLPDTAQTAVEINPQVIQIARMLFELPFEGEKFEILEADGAEYVKTLNGGTDVLLVDGFDGEQIIDDLVGEDFFQDCCRALSANGVFAANWWSGDKRYELFKERLARSFGGRLIAVPAESHGNVAVLAFKGEAETALDTLKRRAAKLQEQYRLDFPRMLADIKAANPHNDKKLRFQAA